VVLSGETKQLYKSAMRRPIMRAIPAQTRNFFRGFNFLYLEIEELSKTDHLPAMEFEFILKV
jgi:hypothetical protein